MICLGILRTYQWIQVIQTIKIYGVQNFRQIRIANDQSNDANITSITFLRSGCEIFSHNFSKSKPSQIDFSSTLSMDGFIATFDLSNTSRGESMYFVLEGSNDGWRTSEVVGSPDIRRTRSGPRFLPNAVPPNPTISLDYRPPWPWYLTIPLPQFLSSILYLGVGVSASFGPSEGCKRFCSLLLLLLSSSEIASLLGCIALGQARESFAPLSGLVLYASLLLVLRRTGGPLIEPAALLALFALASALANECLIFRDCGNLRLDPPFQPALATALLSALLLARRRFLARAARAVLPDHAAAERDWLELLRSDGPALAGLDALARRIARHCPPGPARHLDRQLRPAPAGSGRASAANVLSRVFNLGSEATLVRDDDPTGLAYGGSVPGTVDEARPVRSLDRLYAQVRAGGGGGGEGQ